MAWTERYVRSDAAGGGDGTTDTNSGANGAWTLAEAITNEAAGHRVNIKAGTYSNTTTNRTWATNGNATNPIWWRGFKTTPGDLDAAPTTSRTVSTDMPHITWSTGRGAVTGSHRFFSGISFLTTGASGLYTMYFTTGGIGRFHRCRFESQGSTSSEYPLRVAAGQLLVSECYLKGHASNGQLATVETGRVVYHGNVFSGGVKGIYVDGGAGWLYNNLFVNQAGDAISLTVTNQDHHIINNTIYNPAGHGIAISSTQSTAAVIIINNNLFHTITGASKSGIDFGGATPLAMVHRLRNSYYNVTTPETGFGDTPDFDRVTESSDPLTNPGSGDYSLKTSALSFQTGHPGLFEGLTVRSYASIGAVTPDEVGGGGPPANLSGGIFQ